MATEFRLPEVGEGIESGTVVSVLVSVGDQIAVDQPVLELETDKAVVEVPSTVGGIVEAINVEENQEATVGQVILTVRSEGAAAAAELQGADRKQDAGPQETSAAEGQVGARKPKGGYESGREALAADAAGAFEERLDAAATVQPPAETPRKLTPAAPSVRRLARELGVDIRQVSGSGILGRISVQDVLQIAQGRAPALAPSAPSVPALELPDFTRWGEVERRPMSGIRKATVRAMTTAWATVPMVTHFDKADITRFEALRKQYQPRAEAIGAKLTPTAMLIKIVAAALRRFPDFNASVDTRSSEIVYKRYVNIGVAVDTDHGLLVPVIKQADEKNVLELARELGDLAARARDRKLTPEDMQGGNFSVSNLGGIGGTGFTPIVNPPDVAILGVSRGDYQPVYNRDSGDFEARLVMPLSLTYDHRLIDGAAAARFLRWVCLAIEDPFLMLLEG